MEMPDNIGPDSERERERFAQNIKYATSGTEMLNDIIISIRRFF